MHVQVYMYSMNLISLIKAGPAFNFRSSSSTRIQLPKLKLDSDSTSEVSVANSQSLTHDQHADISSLTVHALGVNTLSSASHALHTIFAC